LILAFAFSFIVFISGSILFITFILAHSAKKINNLCDFICKMKKSMKILIFG